MIPVLVYGWYHQQNFGDDLFIDSFKEIFPELDFTFTNHITNEQLDAHEVVFIGGGSLLNQDIQVEDFWKLESKKIFYIGVGAETNISLFHKALMKVASGIFIRSNDLAKVKEINANSYIINDLVYSLKNKVVFSSKIEKQLLFIPNICVVPKWSNPYWQHTAWNHFKVEMAQTLDSFITNEYKVSCFPMCINSQLNDVAAMMEIMNTMKYGHKVKIDSMITDMELVSNRYKNVEFILTQRYHGMILADLMKKPYVSIFHHDKLKQSNCRSIPYYGFYKDACFKEINESLIKNLPSLPIGEDISVFKPMILKSIGA